MDLYEEIVRLRKDGRRGAVATIVNVRGSIPSFKTAKMLVRDDGSIVGTIGGGCVEAEVWQAAREVMESEKPRTLTFDLNQDPKYDTGLVCGGTLEIFVEPILPPADLYIFGAGHVAASLYKVARIAGFDVTVIDDRETYASRERFPEAQQVIAEDFDKAAAQLAPSESSYIVIVTRGHRDDMRDAALGGADSSPLRRDDWVEAKDDCHFQGIAAGRFVRKVIRSCPRSDRARYWSNHSGRNRSIDHCRADREASERGARTAAHELVPSPTIWEVRGRAEALRSKLSLAPTRRFSMPKEIEIKFRIERSGRANPCAQASWLQAAHPLDSRDEFPLRSARPETAQARRNAPAAQIWRELGSDAQGERARAGRHKTRVELETRVENGEQMDAILRALGFTPTFRYEKYRAEWSDGTGHVVLDETPIGNFGEIEGTPRWIDQTARALGIRRADYITETYAPMFFAWKRRTRSKATEMTFKAVGENREASQTLKAFELPRFTRRGSDG